MPDGIMIEFGSADDVLAAAKALREMGFASLEAFTPFQMPELEEELGLPRPQIIPVLAFGAGASGCGLAFLIVWFCNAYSYALNVGGRPLNSIPADIPLMFETTVLFAGIAAFTLVLLLSGLPRLHHPVMDTVGFERASIDRFWLYLRHGTPELDDVVRRAMLPHGALSFRRFGAQGS